MMSSHDLPRTYAKKRIALILLGGVTGIFLGAAMIAGHLNIADGTVIFRTSARPKPSGSRVRYAAIAADTGLAVSPSADVTVDDARARSGRIPFR